MSWFERNVATYERELPNLLRDKENKFVVLRNAEIVGVFESQREAMDFGYANYQLTEFLTKQILRSDREMLQECPT